MNSAAITIGISALLSGCLATSGSSDNTNWQSNPPLQKFTEVPSNPPILKSKNAYEIAMEQGLANKNIDHRNSEFDLAYDKFANCANSLITDIPYLLIQENSTAAYTDLLQECKGEIGGLEFALAQLKAAEHPSKLQFVQQAATSAMVNLLNDVRNRITKSFEITRRLPGSTNEEKLRNRSRYAITEYAKCLRNSVEKMYKSKETTEEVTNAVFVFCDVEFKNIAKYRFDEELYNQAVAGLQKLVYTPDNALADATKIKESLRNRVSEDIVKKRIEFVNRQKGDRQIKPLKNTSEGVSI